MTKTLFTIIGLSLATSALAQNQPNAQKRVKLNELNKESFSHKVGELYYSPYFKAKTGYDTNSNRGYQNEEEGAYTEASLGAKIHHQLFSGLTLDTDFEIGYRETFGSNDNSGLILGSDSGNAKLGFDFDLSEKMTLSLYNNASIGVDKLADVRDNANSQSQQLWDNDLGLQLHREITDDTGIAAAVGLKTRRDLKDNSPQEEYDETYFGLTLDHQASGRLKLSPFFNYNDREWEQGSNDVETIELGLSTDFLVSDQVNLNFTVAYFEMDFDNNVDKGVGTFGEPSDKEDGVNFGFTISHFATEQFQHTFRVEHETRATTVEYANASEETLFAYNAAYQANEKLRFTGGVTWFMGEDQGNGNGGGEDYDIYLVELGTSYKLTERQEVGLKYSYEEKTSDVDVAGIDAEYDRHLIELNYTYNF
ncbi:hypothetical protein PQO01_01000 [Lentisphaera marina]|uniref:hypothetical protein n=1 Tax=Lentisphaera marina TaxID=1111041 RepID=UPI0023673D4C|nr:hypothetical protein [Lentisphaera marina]MDD7983525.1 hypothetical protein [Lentisphaera marina]